MYLMYHKTTRPTGRAIARALCMPHWGIRAPGGFVDIVVRWGSSKPIDAAMEINSAEAIKLAAHKYRTLRTLENAGLPVVPFSTVPDGWGGYIFGRNFHGFGGRDIQIFDNYRDAAEARCPFYTKYIQSTREFRVHVVGDKVVRVQGKYLDYPDINLRGNPQIKNYANGWRFRTPRQALRAERTQNCIRAVQALGLDFGAVDMMLTADGLQYILEVNTGPSCSPLTARCYVDGIAALIAERTQSECPVNYDALEALRGGVR